MSWKLLERFIESEHFNKDPSLTVAYLARYAEHVGIHYVLCSKLRRFSYEEIEFFLPQLCHLVISIDNESMALEEFIVDLCEESVNGALLTFWLCQTYLHDLSRTPTTNAFQTCRRIYNRVQRIVFGGGEPIKRERIRDNVLPVTVLSSLVLASIAVPALAWHAGPLAVAQARRPRPVEPEPAETPAAAPRVQRTSSASGPQQLSTKKVRQGSADTRDVAARKPRKVSEQSLNGARSPQMRQGQAVLEARPLHAHRQSIAVVRNSEALVSTASLPDQRNSDVAKIASPTTPAISKRVAGDIPRRHSQVLRSVSSTSISRAQKIRMLRQNYFRNQTQLLTALEGISSRLVVVPKPARLSALRAELGLIAQDFPAEVDIPLICPATLVDGTASKSRHHRIVRLNPAEATSLNSAEKVPYLLMLEVLLEDFDFDPETPQNQELLANLLSEKGKPKRRLFDTTEAARQSAARAANNEERIDSVLEPTAGDLSSAALIQDEEGRSQADASNSRPRLVTLQSSGAVSIGSAVERLSTSRNSEGFTSRSSSSTASPFLRASNPVQPDVSALADHMRTASSMLAQLEMSATRRPKNEVAAIRAKIIASMQSLEEQSFVTDDALQTPSFESIIAKAGAAAAQAEPGDIEEETIDGPTDPGHNSGKGAARMENDALTGGLQQRKGDRDDPSAATFGEAWEVKKERIRKTSPYGWIKHWDLISVIVKTGDDLRQEAFACQLITICAKIFAEHGVDVWVKNMRILVTGEASGLIETITNAVSLHSIKRGHTLASIAAGTNPKKRIATLQDHYARSFGADDSRTYSKAMDCFVRSLAAYSIISYVLQLKDRHNGNILIDSDGHVIHIDFGFMLSNSPGNMGFEAAPFKLTMEYVELLGGVDGGYFAKFKELMKDAFQALRREAERIVTLVELMGKESRMPCFNGGLASVVASLRARFVLEKSQEEAREWVDDLVAKSVGSYYTRLYDTYQYRTQGIY